MPQLLDGRKILTDIKSDLLNTLPKLKQSPHLSVLLIGNNPASELYVSIKQKQAQAVGIEVTLYRFDKTVTEDGLIEKIQTLNQDPKTHGIFVQLPLPPHLDTVKIINTINTAKDIDGLTASNLGALIQNQPNTLRPCTPQGCLHLIKHWQPNLAGLHAVIIGKSMLVGKPLGQMLLNEKCTVTQAHSQTKNLANICQTADILVSATGCPGLVTASFVTQTTCVIDVGIAKVNGAIVGDVDFSDVKNKCAAITPVPGGVGPTTVAYLLKNTFQAAQNQQ